MKEVHSAEKQVQQGVWLDWVEGRRRVRVVNDFAAADFHALAGDCERQKVCDFARFGKEEQKTCEAQEAESEVKGPVWRRRPVHVKRQKKNVLFAGIVFCVLVFEKKNV